jgi:imidazolonepropionase-like amidohydrolase
MNTRLHGVLALLLAPVPIQAQDLVHKAAPQAHPIGVRGATLHTVSRGTLENAAIVFADGRITAIAAEGASVPEPPASAGVRPIEWIDGAGLHVYPGFVSFNSVMGLTEVGSVPMTEDMNEAGSITPEVRAGLAINADSWNIPVTRRNGVLTCGVMPTGGRVSGRATVVRMDGWSWEDMELVADAGLVVNWPYAGPFARDDKKGAKAYAEAVRELDELFDAAAAYFAARETDDALETDLRLESLARVLAGDSPLFLGASSLLQIETAVAWAVGRDLRFVLVGGRDAAQCLDLLERHDVAVAIQSTHRLPRRRDLSFAVPYELPGLLQKRGIAYCITTPAGAWTNSGIRNLPYEAAACIAYGLDDEAALRSITLSPAEMLGVGDELGSLDVGKRATLFVSNGDAFDLSTNLLHAFVDGRRIHLTDKQVELDRKYREKYRQKGLLE